MRLITPNLWNFQRVLHTLAATPEVPRYTHLQTRGPRVSGPHPVKPRFRLVALDEGSFPRLFGKEFPPIPWHLKRRRSPQERREELQGRATIPKSPRCLTPFQRNLLSLHVLDFLAEDRLTPRWHVGEPCWKASSESLLGKPRAKATDPLIHATGRVTLMLQIGSKSHVQAPTRDED